jgi:serine/threonine protein kinase
LDLKGNPLQAWQLLIVMEPLPRSTLEDLLEDVGELKLRKALPYWKALLSALVYLHGQGIAHRGMTYLACSSCGSADSLHSCFS